MSITQADTRLHLLTALRAVRKLLGHPDDTTQVVIILHTLRGQPTVRLHARLDANPQGRSILADPGALLPLLADRAAQAALPDGSLGRAYHDFMAGEQLAAEGLANAVSDGWRDAPNEAVARLRQRLRDTHDLGRVLTCYERDPLGSCACWPSTSPKSAI